MCAGNEQKIWMVISINRESVIIATLTKKCGNFGLDTPEGKIKNAQLAQIPSLP